MNRVVNIFSFTVLAVFCLMVMIISYDLSISNLHLKGMPYKQEIFTGLALVVFLFGLIRIQRRWQGMHDMKKFRNFSYVTYVAKSHRQRGILATLLEILFLSAILFFCRLFVTLDPGYVIPMMLVMAVLILESVLFIVRLARGGEAFRVGFNDEVVAGFDREMNLFYYTGLQRVELYQNDLVNFGYREDLNLTFETDIIPKEDRKAFRNALIETLERKNVYVDDSFRNWE